ncbi:MAG: hypothetical protein U5N26_12470 [Candidatus Marinimicrobia bacterium]|nr:hypothetical protein [Candidatus Neomarinimicrobiota bacterium]
MGKKFTGLRNGLSFVAALLIAGIMGVRASDLRLQERLLFPLLIGRCFCGTGDLGSAYGCPLIGTSDRICAGNGVDHAAGIQTDGIDRDPDTLKR